MNNIKRKHHFLSKFYLEGFCDTQGMVWMYKKSDPKNPTASKPENTAFEKNLYHIEPNEDFTNINYIEDLLAEKVESRTQLLSKSLKKNDFLRLLSENNYHCFLAC